MEFSKLSKPDQIIGGAGILFLLSTFFGWFSFDGLKGIVGDISANGWDLDFQWAGLPFLVVLGMIVWIALRRFSSATLPKEIAPLYLAGGATALLPVLKLLIGESGLSRGFGLFLAAITGAAVAFGCYLKFLEAGGDMDELKGQASTLAGNLGDKAKVAAEQAKEQAKAASEQAKEAAKNIDKP
jgi:outer membrane murein-binding lipoprotein Lpp